MGILLSCQELAKTYHARPLFDALSFGILDRDRLGIIGANGAGKSTLLRILAGLEEADRGQLAAKRGLKVAYVPQVVTFQHGETCLEVVRKAALAAGLEADQAALGAARVLGQVGFVDTGSRVESLSGGWTKRLSLAAGLVTEPELLLLDEPTNHLDLEGVLWLETLLADAPFAWAMVSHDRYFLERTATRILELSRVYPNGALVSEGRYSEFLEKRAEYQAQQSSLADSLANKVRREVEWLRRGPKARTTKAQFRIDEAHSMIAELTDVKGRLSSGGDSKIDFAATGRKTKRLIVAEHLQLKAGGRTLLQDLNLVLTPGLYVGLMGGNGTGKTTLLKALLGEVEPAGGTITRADALQVVYFDQNRQQLDPALTLRRTWVEGSDSVVYRGRPVHVATWARRFQFTSSQLDVPVGELSGGEQARAMIAKLMLTSADVLLLDEPTNDLDIPTLEALEESLGDFPGAIVLVSHDRYVVDRVANLIVGLDGQGGARLYADLAQWERDLSERRAAARRAARPAEPATPDEGRAPTKESPKRLSYMEQREYDRMEGEILAAEQELESRQRQMNDPQISTSAAELEKAAVALRQAEERVEALYARWAALEAKLR